MDVYIVKMFFKNDLNLNFKNKKEPSNHEKMINAMPPYIDWVLHSRKSVNYGITFELKLDNEQKDEQQSAHWNMLSFEKDFIIDDVTHSVSCGAAAAILLDSSDKLPAPGSFILNICWDTRGVDICKTVGQLTPVLGALRKLCTWHGGHLQIITDKNNGSLWSVASFMDKNTSIMAKPMSDTELEINNVQHEDLVWRGNLEILSQGTPLHSLPGFTLSKDSSRKRQGIEVSYESENIQDSGIGNDSFTEEQKNHVWFDPSITLLEYIDVRTIPIIFLTGKKFILQYHINEFRSEDKRKVELLKDLLNSSHAGAFLCNIDYAISNNEFEPVPEYSTKNWQNTVLKTPNNMSAPKYRFRHKFRLLHLLLLQSESDRTISENGENNVIQFSAHILHRVSELNLEPFMKCEDLFTETLGTKTGSVDKSVGTMLDDLPVINPSGLFYKDENFNVRISDAIKSCIERKSSTSMAGAELQKLVQDTSMQLNSEQETVLHDLTNISMNSVEEPSHSAPDSDTLHNLELLALRNRDNLRNEIGSSKMRTVKSSDSIRSTAASKPIDMHLKPFDILQHFTLSGQPKNASYVTTDLTSNDKASPSPGKLQNFDQALQLSYHGITYNIDERAAEKQDRMCRRLVERQVKFETSSIGSDEKVPSPATLNIVDSPVRRSSLANDLSNTKTDTQKRIQLQKVAEKLYKKRIRSRSSVTSTSSTKRPPSTSMVLRSTPTKAKSSIGLRSASVSANFEKDPPKTNKEPVVSEEEKRLRRRTYVQDNKKRLQDLVSQSLIENGIAKDSKRFNTCSKRLYNVSMAFLRDLKTSKDLDKIMKQTVSNNVQSVISFNSK